jgi:hypothetical protein
MTIPLRLLLLLIVAVNAGCIQHVSVIGLEGTRSEKYLWVPLLGNFVKFEQPEPSEFGSKISKTQSERLPADATAKRVVPLDVTVTDTP